MEKVLVLRTCAADMSAYGGFVWPESGLVAAPDWIPMPTYGGGLHGLLWGEGAGRRLSWEGDARWLVVSVLASEIVDLKNEVKFPRGEVVFCGTREAAIAYLSARLPSGRAYAICGASAKVGAYESAIVGDYGTASAGAYGTAIAGEFGRASAGDYSIVKVGDYGIATVEDCGVVTAGHRGTVTAGDFSLAVAGDFGRVSAGDHSIVKVGDYGIATVGDCSMVTAGHRGTVTAGDFSLVVAGVEGHVTAGKGSVIRIRTATGIIGQGGLLPGVKYRLDEAGAFVPVEGGK